MNTIFILTAVAAFILAIGVVIGVIAWGDAVWKMIASYFLAFGTFALVLVTIIGWLIWGNVKTDYKKTIEVKPAITKSSTTVFVEYQGVAYQFKSHEDYSKIDDSTCVFHLIESYNMYGDCVRREMDYKKK